MLKRFLDFLVPMCPSGMPHRVRGGVVTNYLGKRYCWHRDCMQANFTECEVNEPPVAAHARGTDGARASELSIERDDVDALIAHVRSIPTFRVEDREKAIQAAVRGIETLARAAGMENRTNG